MAKVIHILKDGTVLDSIEGHIVSYEDCPAAYHILAKATDRRVRERRSAAMRARGVAASNG